MEIIKITDYMWDKKIAMKNTELKDGRNRCFCKYCVLGSVRVQK